MSANVYIDGFNLYYGALKGTAHKWLDLRALSEKLLPGQSVKRIRYYTARVTPRPGDPLAAQRQQVLLRALATIPGVTIHYGHFLSRPVRMALASPSVSGPKTVEVIRTDEKGSDVNLATHLLTDAFDGDFDTALVVSNDSDLVAPISAVRQRFRLKVGVVNPQRNASAALRKAATFYRPLRVGVIASSQLPALLTDNHGTIRKPPGW